MGVQRRNDDARRLQKWRLRRNRLVNRLLTENPRMLTSDAINKANGIVGPMPKARPERQPRQWWQVASGKFGSP
jgi:hypothetical protein